MKMATCKASCGVRLVKAFFIACAFDPYVSLRRHLWRKSRMCQRMFRILPLRCAGLEQTVLERRPHPYSALPLRRKNVLSFDFNLPELNAPRGIPGDGCFSVAGRSEGSAGRPNSEPATAPCTAPAGGL